MGKITDADDMTERINAIIERNLRYPHMRNIYVENRWTTMISEAERDFIERIWNGFDPLREDIYTSAREAVATYIDVTFTQIN